MTSEPIYIAGDGEVYPCQMDTIEVEWTAPVEQELYCETFYSEWMDTACFTASQRISCQTMNPDLFKQCPERGQILPNSAKTTNNRTKSEQIKPELAQVITDSKTGKSYSKGKLLGKVLPLF